MEKATITIDLKKHIHDYLIHEFPVDSSGFIILNERHYVGKMINSMWDASPRPKAPRSLENPVTFILPTTEWSHYVFTNSFIHVPVWREKMVQNFLEVEYRRAAQDFLTVGYAMGIQQKIIIEAFLREYGTKNNADNFDRIKKMDYRKREKFKTSISSAIQKAIL